MSGDLVIGIDPGGTSAWAACSMGEVIESHQGETYSNIVACIRFARDHRDDVKRIGIETQYGGFSKPDPKDPDKPRTMLIKSSLTISKRAGMFTGAFLVAGFRHLVETPQLWEPLPSEWRKPFGLNAGRGRAPIDVQTRLYAGHRARRVFDPKDEHLAVACCISWALWEMHARNNARRDHIAATGGKT